MSEYCSYLFAPSPFHCTFLTHSLQDVQPINPLYEKQRIVIIGAGPTGLGAAQRMLELGIMRSDSQLIILEQESAPGGLATSRRDDEGFLWDMGGHVVFSHYNYFDKSLDRAVREWNKRKRAAFAFMKGSDNERRFVPYPIQENINAMSKGDCQRCLEGLEEVVRNPSKRKPANFDEWLLMNFGKGLCEVFMRKYNRKVWTVDTVDMNAVWVGERVAVPDIGKIRAKITSAWRKTTGLKLGSQSVLPVSTLRWNRWHMEGNSKQIASRLVLLQSNCNRTEHQRQDSSRRVQR